MECLPREGEEVLIHKSLFPPHYQQDLFKDAFDCDYDDLVRVTVAIVAHEVGADGKHIPRICFDV